ncbi:MAG: DUF3822 family protein [Bacteroidota bacterium]
MPLPSNTKAKAQFIDRDYQPGSTKNNRVSIQLRLDGFSFVQIDSISNKVLFFEDFLIPIMLGDEAEFQYEKLTLRFESLLNEKQEFSQAFKSVHIVIDNEFYTLIPEVLYSERRIEDYLKLTHVLPENFLVKSNTLRFSESKLVFGIYAPLFYLLSDHFQNFELRHFSNLFIQQSALLQKTSGESKIYVNVNEKSIYILAFENDKLLFSNSFAFKEKEDFLYYILLIYNQMNFNPEKNPLVFSGNIDRASDLYAIAYQYISNINFHPIKSDGIIFGRDFPETFKSKYCVLIQSVICE